MILMRNGKVLADTHLDEPGCGTQESIKIAAKHRILILNRLVDVRCFGGIIPRPGCVLDIHLNAVGKQKRIFNFPRPAEYFPGAAGGASLPGHLAADRPGRLRLRPANRVQRSPPMSVYNVDL
jgi:hypothetical protein